MPETKKRVRSRKFLMVDLSTAIHEDLDWLLMDEEARRGFAVSKSDLVRGLIREERRRREKKS